MHSRAAAPSAEGVSIKEYIASGIVCVSPIILETKVIVAPNSPNERAKPSTMPAKIPGKDRGSVMLKNTRHGEDPNVRAACSSLGSTFSNAKRIARTTNGNATTAEAKTAPRQLNATLKSNHWYRYFPMKPFRPNPTSNR